MSIISRRKPSFIVYTLFAMLFAACSFDYGTGQGPENERPDIVMENLDYVRVRGGDLLARFHAEHAERWEEQQVMELKNFTFEQMEDRGERVNVEGSAGAAKVKLESGDISLSGGVKINIESEDLKITSPGLEWKDKEKTLTGAFEDEMEVERSDGTVFSGRGFSADIRQRTWVFTGEVKGSYVEKDDDEETGENDGMDEGDE